MPERPQINLYWPGNRKWRFWPLALVLMAVMAAVPAFAEESAPQPVPEAAAPATPGVETPAGTPATGAMQGLIPAGGGEVWIDHRELSPVEKKTGLRFDRGWFLFGQLAGGFWKGKYLTRKSVGSHFGPGGYTTVDSAGAFHNDPREVDYVYSANAGVGRFITPNWSVEFNFAAAVGIKKGPDGKSPFGVAVPANSGDRVSSGSFYHIRNRFYLYDFDPERRLFAFFGAGVTQFNDAYYLPGQPRSFVPDAKTTVFAPSISAGGGLTLIDSPNARVYFESGFYQTFKVQPLDSNQIYTFGIGVSFPLDARTYQESDVQTVALVEVSTANGGHLIMVEDNPLAPVTPGMSRMRIITPEEMRLIAYQNAVAGPPIPHDALEPPHRDGIDFAMDTVILSGMVAGFKRALNITSARGLLKGGYKLWPGYVNNVPPLDDGNPFYTNYILHPYVGALYYMYYRDRGYSRIASSCGSFLVSAVHEFLVEAVYQKPSGIDVLVTPGLGVPLGILMDETAVSWARSDSSLKKVAANFLNPMLGMPFSRFRRGPYYHPETDKVFTLQWNWQFSS